MCGIIGIKFFTKNPDQVAVSTVQKAVQKQTHRGPDYEGVATLGRAVLGHNRLAIIDLNERSNQPFFDVSGKYSIVFNGEIYNYPELKSELLEAGYTFSSSSDTEVLLYHLIHKGVAGIAELDGCFSFAFYDQQSDTLILARDPMGINPLLFSIQEDQISFASELTPFFDLGVSKEIDDEALNELFKYTYIAAPKTILKSVQKLLPGHYLKVQGKNFDIVKYWDNQPSDKFEGSYDDAQKEMRRLVERAVIKRMNADVPLGAFLSGGVDSSIVSAIAANFKDGLNTFSIGFTDVSYFDESKFASELASHIGSVHHPVMLSGQIVERELNQLLGSFDEPFGDSSAIAVYFLTKEAKKSVTVSLSGDGADELLAGYYKHMAFQRSQNPGLVLKLAAQLSRLYSVKGRNGFVANKQRQLDKFRKLLTKNWPDNYWFLASFIDDNDRHGLLKNAFDNKPVINTALSGLSGFLDLDQRFVLQGDMLKKVDLMSMRHSMEVRTPFLDKEVVHFSNSLPDEFKYTKGKGKQILRSAFKDDLPETVFNRSKQGFEVPLEKWIQNSWSSIIEEDWFDPTYLNKQSIFNATFVEHLKETFFSKQPGESATLMWTYIVFQHWYSKWIEKK